MPSLTTIQLEVAVLIVDALHLEVAASDIAPGEALFYDGLGLDSIDALELALEISQKYGFEMRAEDEENQRIFASLRNLSEHIESNRVR
jgi:acyl carrier protein